MQAYKTIRNASEYFLKEKGSKFFAYAYPIDSVEEAKALIEKLRIENPKANHVCSALLIGKESEEYYLVNDDGEPSNSAGMPILAAIRSAEVSFVLVAVVRYFGGTKLGVGGLIQAYRAAAKGSLAETEEIKVEPKGSFTIKANYQVLGEVLSVIDKNNLKIEQEHKADSVSIKVHGKMKDLEQIKALFDRFDLKLT